MERLEALPTREIPPQKKGKRQTRLGSEFRVLHYCSRVSAHQRQPQCSFKPSNLESNLELQVHPKDRHVHLDSGSQKHPNGENLRRRGWEGPYRCPLCLHTEETIDHLLINCDFSKEVWRLALGMQRGVIIPQDTSNLLQHWDSTFPFQSKKNSQTYALWRVLPKFILWEIWLERNNRLFRDLKRSPAQVATKIHALFGESAPYFCQTKNSRALEGEEEQWLVQFKIQNKAGEKAIFSGQEAWELEKGNKSLTNGRQRRINTFCPLTGPPKGTQAWQGVEG
jgi:hypothetical protein